jgi:hypothetical protein
MRACLKLILILPLAFSFPGALTAGGQQAGPSKGFITNSGQVKDQHGIPNPDVLFLYPGKGMNVQLRRNGYSYDLFTASGLPPIQPDRTKDAPSALLKTSIRFSRIDIDFVDMCADTKIRAESPLPGCLNYFINGDRTERVHSYSKVIYENVFPHTDIEFILPDDPEGSFKYNIILHPGADISKVKFSIKGPGRISRSAEGALVLATPNGQVTEWIPSSYYSDAPGQQIPVSFCLTGNIISFGPQANAARTLVIDPSSKRIWGTYYGDAGTDYCNGTRSDAQGNVYITGYTLNTSNIATSGTYQSVSGGSFDAYLVKFDPSGNRTWGTYFGGSSVETAYGICISAQGDIYICGDTFSTSGIASTGAHQTAYGGGIDDAYLAKFRSDGQLSWATYYGGTLHDFASKVTVDNNANVLMCGHSESSNAIATNSAFQNFQAGQFDVFVVKFDSTGVRQWGTYYGDTDVEEAWGITCDNSDNVYITGFTASNGVATTGSHQQNYGGGLKDGFIARINPSGTALNWATYYGGTGDDGGTGIIFSPPNLLNITGNTTSTSNISAPGAYQPAPGSPDDAFITQFSTTGVRQWATYYGGNDVDYIEDLVPGPNASLFICGSTISNTAMSSPGSWQGTNTSPGNYDGYFAKFSAGGQRKEGTFFGGSQQDNARGITISPNGLVYIAGESYSSDSIASSGSFMPLNAGSGDAFLAKFCVAPEPAVSPPGLTTICEGDSIILSTDTVFSTYLWSNGFTSSSFLLPGTAPAGNYPFSVSVSDAYGCTGTSDTVMIVVDVCIGMPEEPGMQLEVFPVPSSGAVNVLMSGKEKITRLTLYSLQGDVVYSISTGESSCKLDLGGMASGTYLLRIETGAHIFQRKIQKQ